MKATRVFTLLSTCCFAMAGSGMAQEAPFSASSVAQNAPACDSFTLQTTIQLSFHQRVCWYRNRLISPSTAMKGAFIAGFGQWRNSPWVKHEDADDFGARYGLFYVRRAGQSTGELLAGYFHNEDPRPHASGEHGVWRRSRAALLSVLITPAEDGGNRPALIPVAGALGSGMTGLAYYRGAQDPFNRALRGAGFSYTTYFGNALLREFQPDVSAFTTRLLHKKNTN